MSVPISMALLILAGWLLLVVAGSWAIICAFIVAGIDYRDMETWHGTMIVLTFGRNKFPKDTCSYWWSLFWSLPLVFVIMTIFVIIRLIYNWILAPLFLGKYVLVTHHDGNLDFKKEENLPKALRNYVIDGLLAGPDEGYEVQGDIPGATKIKPYIWLLAVAFFYATFQHEREIAEYGSRMLSGATGLMTANILMKVSSIVVISMIIGVIISQVYKHRDRIRESWDILHGKMCRKIPERESADCGREGFG